LLDDDVFFFLRKQMTRDFFSSLFLSLCQKGVKKARKHACKVKKIKK